MAVINFEIKKEYLPCEEDIALGFDRGEAVYGNNNVTINIYKNGQIAHSWAKAYETPEKGLKLRKEAEEVLKEFGFMPAIR